MASHLNKMGVIPLIATHRKWRAMSSNMCRISLNWFKRVKKSSAIPIEITAVPEKNENV